MHPPDSFAAVYKAQELEEGNLRLDLELPGAGEPPLTKELLALGRLLWVSATHAEASTEVERSERQAAYENGGESHGWKLTFQTVGDARYDENPVEVLKKLARVKGYTIPGDFAGTLESLRAHFNREGTATGPEFRSEGPRAGEE